MHDSYPLDRNLVVYYGRFSLSLSAVPLYLRTLETKGKGDSDTATPAILGAMRVPPHLDSSTWPSLAQRARARRAPTLVRLRVRNPPPRLRRVILLLVRSEEVVVGRVGLELSLTHGADGGRNSSAGSVQTLDEGGLEQEVTARGPLLVPHRLQQEALNRTAIRATRGVGAGVDSVHLYRPHPAAIEGTLPRRVPTQRGDDARLRVFIDALEVRDDLELRSEEIRKQGGFGAGAGVPGSAATARRQASIALATEGVADQVRRVSCRYCNKARSGWGRDLRRRKGDCAEGTCEHESGHEQAPNSRSL